MSSPPTDSASPFRRFQRYGLNAWVLIPSWAFGLFTWVSFFILGVRARRRDWILTGAAYAVFSALAFFAFGRPEVEYDDTANGLLGLGLIVAWIGGAIHAGITYWIFTRQGGAQPAGAPWTAPSRRRAETGPTSDDLGLGFGNPAADYPGDLAVHDRGLYIVEGVFRPAIRKVDRLGIMTTLAGGR